MISAKSQLADIDALIEDSRTQIKRHSQEIDALRDFCQKLKIMTDNEIPEFSEKMGDLCGIFLQSLDKEQQMIDGETTLMEDLNDISARYYTVFRISSETVDAKIRLKTARERIDSLNAESQKNPSPKIDAKIVAAKEERDAALSALSDKINEFMGIRKKYNVFKVKRLRHGYSSFGKKMKESMTEQIGVLERFRDECAKARSSIDEILSRPAPVQITELVAAPAGSDQNVTTPSDAK